MDSSRPRSATFRTILAALGQHDVGFVIIGAVALVLHGSARVTRDLDICYGRERANLERLAKALKPFKPTLRGAPDDLPFTLDAATLDAGLNFTLRLSAGDLDLLGEVTGIGDHKAVPGCLRSCESTIGMCAFSVSTGSSEPGAPPAG